MEQLLLIVNPGAGTKKASKHLAEIISIFNHADFDTHVCITEKYGDAIDAIKKLGSKMDLIVCCGGDGTLNETVTGIIEAGLDLKLGYIPAGSTNDFASSLKLSGDILTAAKQIIDGDAYHYDVGKFDDRYFTYVASFGAFTKASYATPSNIKNTLGHMAYILGGIQELSNIRAEHIRMELDGEVLEDNYLFGAICNSTSLGGILTLDPCLVDMSDGKLELLLIRAPKDIQELHECIIALTTQKYNCGMITFRSAASIKVETEQELTWSLDGERADASRAFQIEAMEKRIRLIH